MKTKMMWVKREERREMTKLYLWTEIMADDLPQYCTIALKVIVELK